MLVNDTARLLLEMLQKELSGLYHVVGAQPMSKYQFGVEIARTFGLREDLISPQSVESVQPDRQTFPQFMAVYPQTIHRSGARNPRVFHRFGGVLYTVPAGLSTENQELSTRRNTPSITVHSLSTYLPTGSSTLSTGLST